MRKSCNARLGRTWLKDCTLGNGMTSSTGMESVKTQIWVTVD
jgi:hypothetical protein